jgi:hypothetical protein
MWVSWRRTGRLKLPPYILRLVHLGGRGGHWPLGAGASYGSDGGVYEHGFGFEVVVVRRRFYFLRPEAEARPARRPPGVGVRWVGL